MLYQSTMFTAAAAVGLALTTADASAMDLSASPLVQGEIATFTVTGAAPGALVVFVGGPRTGACPAGRVDAAECVVPGVVLGRILADADGTAVLERPLRPPPGDYVFQALVPGARVVSPVLRAPVVEVAPSLVSVGGSR